MQTDFKLYKVDMKYIREQEPLQLVDTTIFKRDRENIIITDYPPVL